MSSGALDVTDLLGPIRRIHERVRDAVVAECETGGGRATRRSLRR